MSTTADEIIARVPATKGLARLHTRLSARAWATLAVLCLTLLGGILRFYKLDRPILWGDEALVFTRATGPFTDLVQILRNDGFTPLHYEAYWWMQQQWLLTPWRMRLLPAVCGTLMVPAMYFLSRQLAGRKVSLIATLFTACSAWMLFYARDCKMYCDAWLFAILNIASFLWAVRTSRTREWWNQLPWFAWIASGVAMVGTHALGFIALALQPLWLLSARRLHWRTSIATALGIGVIVFAPIYYFNTWSRWFQRVDDMGVGYGGGIEWVRNWIADRHGPEVAGRTATVFLFGYDFPDWKEAGSYTRPPRGMQLRQVDRRIWSTGVAISAFLAIAFAAGAFPWRKRKKLTAEDAEERRDSRSESESKISNLKSEIWNLESSPLSASASLRVLCGESSASRPWWRILLWLSIWIVLPAYGFYALSLQPPASPGDWLESAGSLLTGQPIAKLTASAVLVAILVVLAGAAAVAALCHFGRRCVQALTAAAITAFSLTLIVALLQTGKSAGLPLPSATRWSAASIGLIAGAGLLIGGYILWTGPRPALSGRSWSRFVSIFRTRPDETGRGTPEEVTAPDYPRWIILVLLAAGALASGVAFGLLGLWIVRGTHLRDSSDLFDQWLAIVADRQVLLPLLAAALGLSFHHAGRTLLQRLAKSAILIATVAAVLLLCAGICEAAIAKGQQIVWFPRYLGVIWPGLAIGVAALVMRLPHGSLRTLVLGVLLGANLTQFFAWIYVPADPPIDVQAADAVAAKLNPSEVKVYFNGPEEGSARSIESIYSTPGRYYILSQWATAQPERYQWLKTHNCHSTNGYLLGWDRDYFREQFQLHSASERLIATQLAANPLAKRLILWDQLAVTDTPPGPDTMSARLGPGWRPVRTNWYPVRYLLRWHEMEPQRRREWEKVEQK